MTIKILILETATVDLNFMYRELDHIGFTYTVKKTKLIDEFDNITDDYNPDILISGYSKKHCNGKEALKISYKWYPSIPFILIADHIEVENCIELIKKGVSDIILQKDISSLANKIKATLKQTPPVKVNIRPIELEEHHSDNSKYSSLIRNSTDAILLTLKNGQILEANPAACKIFKMTEAEICLSGRNGLVDAADPNLSTLLQERKLRGAAKGELTFKRKDGSSFIAEITSVVFKDTLGYETTSIIIKDLTHSKKVDKHLAKTAVELQEAVNRLNKVMNASMDLIFSTDAEKKITQINSACFNILGYHSHELLHKNYIDLLYKEDQEAIFLNDKDIRNGNPLKNFEARIIHKNGSTVYILLSAQWDKNDKLIYCTAKDITDKKKLEKAYEIERERFVDLYNFSPACMAVLKGPTHIHELTNSLYLKFLNKKDVLGKSVLEILPEMDSQGIIKLLDDVYTTGVPFIANEMLIRIDLDINGSLIDKYMNFVYQAHRDSLGKIDGIFVFAIDVTEQVLSRIQIEESEKMYHQLISELPVAAYSCDAEGKIVFFNKAASKLWGKDPKLREDSFCGFSKVFDDNGHSIPLNRSPMATSLKEGIIVSAGPTIVQRADGDRRCVVPHVVPYLDLSGKVTGAVNMIMDITESKITQTALELQNTQLAFQNKEKEKRAAELIVANEELAFQNKEKEKRAEELIVANKELVFQNKEKEQRAKELGVSNKELANYKYTLDQSSIVVITDAKGIIIHANDNFCKISKYSRKELIGENYKIISSDYHSEEFTSTLWKTIAKGNTWKGELQNRAKDETNHWVDTTITPFLNELGEPFQYVAIKFDITERKKAEIDLEKQNIELLKTNKELDRFVYSVSHDLRSPLTSIQGLVSIIEDESEEPETLKHIQMISASIDRLDEFIKRILSYSQNNRTDLEIEYVPVKEIILNTVEYLQNMKQAKGISFAVDVLEQYPFYSDNLRFNTIIENLISNAIKYHKPNGVDRFIKVKAIVKLDAIEIEIADNGIGIPIKYHEKIFDMFFRISSKSKGSGIGLYIVKDTVEKIEGSITIYSQIKIGTTFKINLKNFKTC